MNARADLEPFLRNEGLSEHARRADAQIDEFTRRAALRWIAAPLWQRVAIRLFGTEPTRFRHRGADLTIVDWRGAPYLIAARGVE